MYARDEGCMKRKDAIAKRMTAVRRKVRRKRLSMMEGGMPPNLGAFDSFLERLRPRSAATAEKHFSATALLKER